MSNFSNTSQSNLSDTAVTLVVTAISVGGTVITATVCGILCIIAYGLKKYCEYRYQIEVLDRQSMGGKKL